MTVKVTATDPDGDAVTYSATGLPTPLVVGKVYYWKVVAVNGNGIGTGVYVSRGTKVVRR